MRRKNAHLYGNPESYIEGTSADAATLRQKRRRADRTRTYMRQIGNSKTSQLNGTLYVYLAVLGFHISNGLLYIL